MDKILLGAGHHPNYPGACYFNLREYDIVKRMCLNIFTNFKDKMNLGIVADNTNVKDYNSFMKWKVDWINKYNPDLYIEFHLNADASGLANGVEVLVNPKFAGVIPVAEKLVNFSSLILGNKNRGVVKRDDLYVLNTTKCNSMIYEVYFLSNKKEVDTYNFNYVDNVVGWVLYRALKSF